MKLYFYILQKKCIAAAADIRCEECAVTEKEKSFHPVEKFPKGIYRKLTNTHGQARAVAVKLL